MIVKRATSFPSALPKRRRVRLALFVVAHLGWMSCPDAGSAAPIMEKPAPSLVAVLLNGDRFDLSKLRGKVVLVNYWATWCAPCKKEMPVLNKFYQRHHDEGLEIIGISADRPKDFEKMRKMSKSLSYPTATVDQITDDGFGSPEGFPLTYVIDRNGVIRDKFIDVREQLLQEVVQPLLSQ